MTKTSKTLSFYMVTRLISNQYGWMFRLTGLFFASVLFIASNASSTVLAQSADNPWAEPLNLSHSGTAMNPAVVADSAGVVHVVWQDDLANYSYTRFDDGQWSAPLTTDLNLVFRLPIAGEAVSPLVVHSGPNPLFLAGPGQDIFAFWINPQGRLFTSSVENQSFGNVAAWNSGRLIAPGVGSFTASIDASGEWHVAFFRTAEDTANPPGIYYTRSKNNGLSWATPVRLYESPYFRRLAVGEANLSLVTSGTEDELHVYVAWENRPRKQVFLAQSADGGETWGQPMLVAGPAPGSGSSGPFNIQVGANQNSVVLVWQTGRPEGSCSQIFQFSGDEGVTWSNPQPMIEELLGCGQSNEFVTGLADRPDDPLYHLTKTKSQVFLTAWNDIKWSQPQVQPILSGFEEPEIFTEVLYSCHQASMQGKQLYIVGCDQGGGGDVWITSRDLDVNTSSLQPTAWSNLSPVASDNLDMESIDLVATNDDLIHAFFSQHQDSAIYYTFWDGELWSRITPVLTLPDGETGWPVVSVGPNDELFLLALNNRGWLYFSRAASGNTSTESLWSTPKQLDTIHNGEIGSVDVGWDTAGKVFVAYSVPVNEHRGIYLVQSEDNGISWSEPLKVFDGAAAGFDLVASPSLLITENGELHIIWKQQSVQGERAPQSLSLYYTRSDDGGNTFSEAEIIIEEPVAWRDIVVDAEGNLHLLWQQQENLTTVWDQVSNDGGDSWQFPQGLPIEGATAAVVVDSAGQPHVVNAGQGSLGQWLWDGSRWQSETPLRWSLASQQEEPLGLLAAAVNKQGKMVVVLEVPIDTGSTVEWNLHYSTRTLDLPRVQTNVQEATTQTLLAPTIVPATATADRLSTPTSMAESEPVNSQGQTDRNESNARVSPFTMALLPVALLLLIVLGVVLRRATQAKDR